MANYVPVPDLLFKGAQVYTLEGATTSTDPAPAPQPPAPTPTLVLPANLANRTRMEISLPCGDVARKYSPHPLDDTNVLICKFSTGATPITARDLRLQAAEYGGNPTPRIALLIRNSDGAVLATQMGTTVTQWMSFVKKVSTLFYVAPPVLEVNTDYSWVVYNQSGAGPSTLFVDFYI